MFESNITIKEKKNADGTSSYNVTKLSKKELATIVEGLKLLGQQGNSVAMWLVSEMALYAEGGNV